MEERVLVGVVMGSEKDLKVMKECGQVLERLGVPHETSIASTHRTPERVAEYARSAQERGLQVIIAGAGKAAHLAGTIASHTLLPVIGVPLTGSPLNGLDALLSTVQMPGGIPVATVDIDGARNAAVLAAEILALSHPDVRERLQAYRRELGRTVGGNGGTPR